MKVMYRRATPTGYSKRAARSEAKKLILAMLADAIRSSAICGYEETLVSAEKVDEQTERWPSPWREGTRREIDAAAMELLDEFRRRADR